VWHGSSLQFGVERDSRNGNWPTWSFEKRAQKTAQSDLDLGKSRYADLLKWRREEGL
jgi:hypothetical protein